MAIKYNSYSFQIMIRKQICRYKERYYQKWKGSYDDDLLSVKAHGKYQYEIYYINVPEFLKGFSQNI